MSKSILPFVTAWSDPVENYSAPGKSWNNLPTREDPGIRFFSPQVPASARHVNYALWESQKAAQNAIEDSISRDFEDGSVLPSPVTGRLYSVAWNDVRGEWLLAGFHSSAGAIRRLISPRRGVFDSVTYTPSPSDTSTLVAIGTIPRSVAKAASTDIFWAISANGELYEVDRATGAATTRHSGPNIRAGAFRYSEATGKMIFAYVGSASALWQLGEVNAGGGASATVSSASSGTSTSTGLVITGNGQMDLAVEVYQNNGSGSNSHYMYSYDGTSGWTELTASPLAGVGSFPSGGVDIIGADYDPVRGYFLVAWYKHTGSGSPAWGIHRSTNGVGWEQVTSVSQFMGEALASAPLDSGGLVPLAFAVYQHAWVVLVGAGNKSGLTPLYSFDQGATWHAATSGTVYNGANYALPLPGLGMPALVKSPKGFMIKAPYTADGTTGSGAQLYFSPTGGVRPSLV